MASVPDPYLTPEEYLALERGSLEAKHEYIDGQIVALAGATGPHNQIVFNIAGVLWPQLRSGPCQGFTSDMRVKVPGARKYTYPDVVIACDVVFEDDQEDTLLDPVVVFEVLSHSTEAYDRGKKFAAYQTLASLQEYLLVSQDQPRMEHFIRQPNGDWILKVAQSLEESVRLTSVPGTLPLAEVYDRVRFET